ncbi:hypothetical protein [Pedobacter alluvionis]|uniref:Uncharacterized protein n=1 Tax=Pedobacter alluvionis TaxID=475253 RepID=A0A497YD33_9SPHI|nr:hypothetical protein [Pedobacter alluvionis]RLJ80386.1 hypothetical protein BCL90_1149 [Pedobacter alluvionis]TFB31655.1 hypothetical protein E3V97_13815 [Pedobacter alluvionis]
MNIYYINQELKYAREDFESFVNSFQNKVNFNPLDPESYKYWNTFIDHVCNSFNKVENLNKTSKGEFRKVVGEAINLKRTDPLLLYVRECRNAYQHSNQEMCTMEIISNIPVDTFELTRLDTDENGNEYPVETTTHNLYPSAILLKTVVNRGVAYIPPGYHLGNRLKKYRDPIEVGLLTIKYYEGLYNQLENL